MGEEAYFLNINYNIPCSPSPVSSSGSGIIPADSFELSISTNHKYADLYIDTDDLIGLPAPFSYSGTFNGVIDLHFDVINDYWQKTETHRTIDYGDYTVLLQGKSHYNGAYVEGTFGDLEVTSTGMSTPQGQVGTTDTFQLTKYK